MAATGLGKVYLLMSSLSLIATQTTRNRKLEKDICHPLLQRQMMQWLRKPHKMSSWSTARHRSRPLSRAQSNQRTMMPTWTTLKVPAALPLKRVIALAIILSLPLHVPRKRTCGRQAMMQGVRYPHRTRTSPVIAPDRTSLSPQSSDDQGLRLILGEHNQRSHANHLPQHPGNRSTVFQNMEFTLCELPSPVGQHCRT